MLKPENWGKMLKGLLERPDTGGEEPPTGGGGVAH